MNFCFCGCRGAAFFFSNGFLIIFFAGTSFLFFVCAAATDTAALLSVRAEKYWQLRPVAWHQSVAAKSECSIWEWLQSEYTRIALDRFQKIPAASSAAIVSAIWGTPFAATICSR